MPYFRLLFQLNKTQDGNKDEKRWSKGRVSAANFLPRHQTSGKGGITNQRNIPGYRLYRHIRLFGLIRRKIVETKRKVQLSAAVVIANGLLALGLLHPRVSLATSCPDEDTCGTCLSPPVAACNNVAPPGCTFLSATCGGPVCFHNIGTVHCVYQPT